MHVLILGSTPEDFPILERRVRFPQDTEITYLSFDVPGAVESVGHLRFDGVVFSPFVGGSAEACNEIVTHLLGLGR